MVTIALLVHQLALDVQQDLTVQIRQLLKHAHLPTTVSPDRLHN